MKSLFIFQSISPLWPVWGLVKWRDNSPYFKVEKDEEKHVSPSNRLQLFPVILAHWWILRSCSKVDGLSRTDFLKIPYPGNTLLIIALQRPSRLVSFAFCVSSFFLLSRRSDKTRDHAILRERESLSYPYHSILYPISPKPWLHTISSKLGVNCITFHHLRLSFTLIATHTHILLCCSNSVPRQK